MKVILLETIKKLGNKGDIVEVSDGQAKNFLIPKKMAEEANSKNINFLNQRNKSIEKKEGQLLNDAKIIEKKINDIAIFIKAKENNGKLFGSITNSKISSELNKYGIKIEKKNIEIKTQITSLGKHEIRIKLYKNFYVKKQIEVIKESN
ncbi:50S ribosomal protein L9 [bacterium]|nr:50S ribosomal protein L9 [bacterium]|tara:strand:+ start:905 stop:1351 length:447 start_codon:yes stop_codon:yes gene_type:complete